jgi:hypothetical protein
MKSEYRTTVLTFASVRITYNDLRLGNVVAIIKIIMNIKETG